MKQAVGQRALQNERARKQLKKNVESILASARALHDAGRHVDVQALCDQVLQHLPNHLDALNLFGLSKAAAGRFEEAETIMRRALAIDPRSAVGHYNIGVVQFAQKHFNQARASYEMAVVLQPNFPAALSNLGNAFRELDLLHRAVESYDRALAQKPDYADAVYNRAQALFALGRQEDALTGFDRCLALQPGNLQALNTRGLVQLDLKQLADGLASFERALAIKPDFAGALSNRGRALSDLGRFDEAIQSCEKALQLEPGLETAWIVLAYTFLLTRRLADAFAAARRALAIVPNSAPVLLVLAECFAKQGDSEEALRHFDAALAVKPDFESALTKKIFALDFAPGAGFARQQDARKAWWDQIGARFAPSLPANHANDRDPSRRIVLGYVSSDFRHHSAALCFISVLRNHDKAAFEVVCYSCSPFADSMTEEFRRIADKWRDASQLSDDRLDAQIRADKIDILVDLSGHTAGHRLRVFARKPSPIQVTAWGGATGTGLPTIDYMFSDPVATPQHVRHLFVERIHDLPCAVTLAPPPAQLNVAEPPCLASGTITFGVFNRIEKISDETVKVWSTILRAVPGARLMIKDAALNDAALARLVIERFIAQGISAERIVCRGGTSRPDHLAAFSSVDICLDPFPQNGGVSTWEALQMGVPVVARLGHGSASRIAAAILSSTGLEDWIGDDEAAYIDIAVKFAAMPADLAALRAELPARVAACAAGNPSAYTGSVEHAYRGFWKRYCESSGGSESASPQG